jgi:large subunit ribosomal protein LX
MKAFKITGTFKMGRNKNQFFTKEVIANNKNQAKEKIYSDLGSKHKIKRNFIDIVKVQEISAKEVTSPLIKGMMEKG